MKKNGYCYLTFCVFFLFAHITIDCYQSDSARVELKSMYELSCRQGSDINEHVSVLKELAAECSSAMEIGIRSMVSSWGVLQGLSESPSRSVFYIGIDLNYPPISMLNLAKKLAQANGIDFQFWKQNDMEIDINDVPVIDLLFIDSLHTYCHLTYELEKFSPKTSKYIAMHDTSAPWGDREDSQYTGNYSEYPAHFDRTKKGLWPAVEDFLKRHPEWVLQERRLNNHGFTILKRIVN